MFLCPLCPLLLPDLHRFFSTDLPPLHFISDLYWDFIFFACSFVRHGKKNFRLPSIFQFISFGSTFHPSIFFSCFIVAFASTNSSDIIKRIFYSTRLIYMKPYKPEKRFFFRAGKLDAFKQKNLKKRKKRKVGREVRGVKRRKKKSKSIVSI